MNNYLFDRIEDMLSIIRAHTVADERREALATIAQLEEELHEKRLNPTPQ